MRISDAESIVMTELWRAGEATAEALVDALAGPQGWQEATIKTLLNRLLNKGAIEAERIGRRYLYRPRLERAQWELEESTSLLDRVFGGRVAPMLAHFSQHGRLSRSDLAELKSLLEDLHDDD